MPRNTRFSVIAVAASIVLIGSQADAQHFGNKSRNQIKENAASAPLPRNNCSNNRGITITNSAATSGNSERKYLNRFDSVRSRKSKKQPIFRSQRDEPNRFGAAGSNALFENSRTSSCPPKAAFVPQVPTPAIRPRPRLIPNEFIVGLSNRSRFTNVSKASGTESNKPETENQTSAGQPVGNPFYSILVIEE